MRNYLLAAGILIVTAASFAPALNGAFIWDDDALIVNNPSIRSFRHAAEQFMTGYWNEGALVTDPSFKLANRYYRPLVSLSFTVDYALFGLDPRGYHLTNILWHLLAVVLVWRFAVRLLNHQGAAASCALLFAVHPTRAESVAWISGRTDVMMAVFFVAALLLFWSALAATPGPPLSAGRGRARIVAGAAGWVLYACALLCKESAVVLMVIVPVLDLLVINRDCAQRWRRNLFSFHRPLVIVTAGYIIVRLTGSSVAEHADLPVGEHLQLIVASAGHYARMTLNPFHPSMLIDRSFPAFSVRQAAGVGAAAMLAWLVAVVAAARTRQTVALLSLVWLGAGLAPVLNIKDLHLTMVVAERFYYLPFVGVALLAALGGRWMAQRGQWQRVAVCGLGVMLVCLWGVATAYRSADYTNNVRFWRAEVSANPLSPVGHHSLADALMARQRFGAAAQHFAQAYVHWHRYGAQRGKPLLAMLGYLEARLLASPPLDPSQLARMDSFLAQLTGDAGGGRPVNGVAELRLGSHSFGVAVDQPRVRRQTRAHLGRLLSVRGMVLSRLGRDGEAIPVLQQTLAQRPTDLPSLVALAMAYLRTEQAERADELLLQARQRWPEAGVLPQLAHVVSKALPRIRQLQRAGLPETQRLRLKSELSMLTQCLPCARHQLEQLIEIQPQDEWAHSMLVLELASAHQVAAAQAALQRARRTFGPAPWLDDLESRAMKNMKSN